MGSNVVQTSVQKRNVLQTFVCVKQVKDSALEEWNETMLLPGDVIVGISEKENDHRYFFGTSFKSELQSHLGKLQHRINNDGKIWVTIKRAGNRVVKLPAFMVSYRSSRFLRRYTIRTASNDRQFAVLGDLTLDQCSELQGTRKLAARCIFYASFVLCYILFCEHKL